MKLGRFDHHPDPAIDFCIEVDAIEAEVFDATHGLISGSGLNRRIERALEFRVGGDIGAVNAKASLRRVAREFFERASP